MEYRRIGIYGVSCTGKTVTAKLIEKINPNYKFIDGSSIIDEVCPGGLANFKSLSYEEKNNYRKAAIDYILLLQKKIKKHFVIAGHYSFLLKNHDFEVAWTKRDEDFYTDIFLLSSSPKEINDRLIYQGKCSYKLDEIQNWMDFEESGIDLLSLQNVYKVKIDGIRNKALS